MAGEAEAVYRALVARRFGGDENGKIAGRSVLLVDDVFTTGSTVNECARVLKKMGAASVFSLTVARVDNKKVDV